MPPGLDERALGWDSNSGLWAPEQGDQHNTSTKTRICRSAQRLARPGSPAQRGAINRARDCSQVFLPRVGNELDANKHQVRSKYASNGLSTAVCEPCIPDCGCALRHFSPSVSHFHAHGHGPHTAAKERKYPRWTNHANAKLSRDIENHSKSDLTSQCLSNVHSKKNRS